MHELDDSWYLKNLIKEKKEGSMVLLGRENNHEQEAEICWQEDILQRAEMQQMWNKIFLALGSGLQSTHHLVCLILEDYNWELRTLFSEQPTELDPASMDHHAQIINQYGNVLCTLHGRIIHVYSMAVVGYCALLFKPVRFAFQIVSLMLVDFSPI